TDRTLSGTFECSLPEGDSPSYFAVFPDGERTVSGTKTQRVARPTTLPSPEYFVKRVSAECWGEAHVAAVVRAPRSADVVGDEQRERNEDPDETPRACFRGPVGRVRPGGFVRVVVASEGPLAARDGRAVYRLALPSGKLRELSLSVQADEALA